MEQALQMRMQMKISKNIMETCQSDCVNSFKDGKLTASETTCLQNCMKRHVAAMQAFGEHQQAQQARGGAF